MSAVVVDGGIMEYLCASDVDTLDALYSDRYTCLAVFRSLSRYAHLGGGARRVPA